MRRNIVVGALALAAALILLLVAGGAVQWQRIAPYEAVGHWAGESLLNEPTGIAASGRYVFVSDARNARVQVFDHCGTPVRTIGDGVLRRPMNLSLRGDRLYVADYFRDAIATFDIEGRMLRWAAPEDGLTSPGGVDAYPDGSLLVADTYGQRVVHFAEDGRLRRTWGGDGIRFNYPTDVAITDDGGFVVADGYNDRVQQFDADGQLVRRWGGPFALNIRGPFPGWFATAASIAVGPDGRIAVADYFNNRLQVFDARGRFLTAMPQRTSGSARHSAMGVAFAPDGTLWATHHALHAVEAWAAADPPLDP